MKLTLVAIVALTGVFANPIAEPNANAEPETGALAKRATCKFVTLFHLLPFPYGRLP
jgi:hypothetical protein